MSEDNIKVRENRLRRMAARQLLTLSKSRRRDQWASDYGKYHLVDDHNTVVCGAEFAPHCATLDEIEYFLTDDTRPRYVKAPDGEFRWHIPDAAPAKS